MEDLGIWARGGSEGIGRVEWFLRPHRKDYVLLLVSPSERGDEVNGSREIARLVGWIFELHIVLDIGIDMVKI
jgi:hypothetical protein